MLLWRERGLNGGGRLQLRERLLSETCGLSWVGCLISGDSFYDVSDLLCFLMLADNVGVLANVHKVLKQLHIDLP